MKKWISGCLVVAVVAAASIAFWGYKKDVAFTAGGGSTIVTIAASPARVFASLANADSLATWSLSNKAVTVSHHGTLVVGDTLHGGMVDVEQTSGPAAGRAPFTWTVTEVDPNHMLVLEMRNDSTGHVFAVQRDSLVAIGDSTTIISTIESPTMDSLRTTASGTGKAGAGAFLDVSAKLMISAFRMQADGDLKRLKARIEGGSAPKVP